jgi:hypothetical protein
MRFSTDVVRKERSGQNKSDMERGVKRRNVQNRKREELEPGNSKRN